MLLIFDCDGVLVDSEMIASRVLAAALSEAGYPVTSAQCRARYTGKRLRDVVSDVKDQGTDLPEDFLDRLKEKDQQAFEDGLEPVSGIGEVMAELSHNRCVASSGSPEKIRTNLGLTGLLPFFDPYLFSARDVAQGKPAPDLFLFAAQNMGMPPDRCLVIEDSVAGVTAARRAGMRVLGFHGASHAKDEPGYAESLMNAGALLTFDTMADLPRLIGQAGP